MSEVTARAEIMNVIAQIVEDFTAYPLVVEPDNRKVVDQGTQTKPYLAVMIDFLTERQMDLSNRPRVQAQGQIVICVVVKENSGTAAGATLRDFIEPYFSLKNLGTVNCHATEKQRTKVIAGWEYMPILINFWQNKVSA